MKGNLMHWKVYRETVGKPPTHEVVIQYDLRDADHPFLLDRIRLYEGRGKKIVRRPVDVEKRKSDETRPTLVQ